MKSNLNEALLQNQCETQPAKTTGRGNPKKGEIFLSSRSAKSEGGIAAMDIFSLAKSSTGCVLRALKSVLHHPSAICARHNTPARLLAAATCWILLSASAAASFSVGSRVLCNDSGVNVRSSAAGTVVGTQSRNVQGTVTGGPTNASIGGTSYTWYNVNFDSGTDGWVASIYLSAASLPRPTTSSVSPSSVVGSSSPRTFTVNGSNFVSGSLVQVAYSSNGYSFVNTNTAATFVSSSRLTVPINTTTEPDTWRVRVRNPDGQTSSGYETFTVTAPPTAAPAVSSVSPSSVVGSTSSRTFTISGSNFVSGALVQVAYSSNGYSFVNTNTAATFVNSSTLTVPINTTTEPDTWRVRVRNPDGQTSSGFVTFTVTAPQAPAPTVSGVSPNSVVGSNTARTFTVSGSNFVSGSLVQVAYSSNGYSFVNTNTAATYVNQNTLTVPINTTTEADTWRVRVRNPDGQTSSGFVTFTVTAPQAPAPTVSGVSPNSVVGSNTARTFTVSGTNFVSGSLVQVAYSSNGYSFVNTNTAATYVNQNTLTVPINTTTEADTWRVRVRNPDGQTSSGFVTFTVTAPQSPPGSLTLTHETPVWDATSAGGPAVRLNWTASTGAASYEVLRNGAKIFPTSGTYTGLTFYNIAGLTSGQTYTYQIVARNAGGTTSSNSITVGPMPYAPVALPGTFTLSHGTPFWDSRPPAGPAVDLSWTPSAGASSYIVLRNGVRIFPTTGTFNGTAFSNTKDLLPGVTYAYTITASNVVGTRSSNTVTITMPAAPGAPNAPSGLAAVGGVGLVSLAWTDNSTTETGFRIERTTGTSGSWSQLATTGASIAAYIDRAVVNGTRYTYRVRATSSGGDSAWSAEAGATPAAAGAPGAFTLSHQTPQWNNGAPSVVLNWTTSDRAAGYEVMRDGSLQQSGITGLSFTSASGLSAGQTYSYQIIARNSAGTVQSNFIRVTMPTGSTQPPGNFALRHDPPVWDDRAPPGPAVRLTWDAADGADGYEVFRNGVRIFPAAGAPRFTQLAFRNETGMVGGSAYTFQIFAINGGGRTPSNEVTITMPTANDTGIGGFNLVAQPASWIPGNPGRAAIQLTWTAASGASGGYVIFRNNTRLHPASGSTQALTFTDSSGLIPGQTYTYHISASGSSGTPRISNSVRQTVPLDIASAFCDLSVADFTIGVTTAKAGEQVPLTLRIQNAGPRASRASGIRFFVSLDRNWSGDDLPCEGPATELGSIPPNDFRMINPWPRLPAAVPQQNYFIVCRLDPEGRAGQTDVTNDMAGSATFLAVAPSVPNLMRPSFLSVPKSQTIRNNASWPTLAVKALGTPPLRYQWKRNGVNIANATTSTYTPPNRFDASTGKIYAYSEHEGAYTVVVTNDAGSAETSPAYLSLESPNPRPGLFNDVRRLSWLGSFDPNLPSVVITHGWQPTINFASYYTGYPLDWMLDMANAIDIRLKREEGELPRAIQKANVFFFCWSAAHTELFDGSFANLSSAGGSTDNEGALLAKLLSERLGAGYSKKIHFIGHSLGTVVNAHAAKNLKVGGYFQFTILDAPINLKAQASAAASSIVFPDNFGIKPLFFSNTLQGSKVVLMDNYYGGSLTPFPPAFGAIVPGAGPNGGLKYSSANHSGVHQCYLDTIKKSVQEGFYHSILMPDYGSRPMLSFSLPKTYVGINDFELVDTSRQIISGIASGSRALVGGAWRWVTEMGGSTSSAQSLASSAKMAAASTAADKTIMAYHLVVPKHTLRLAFDFRLVNVAHEDELQVWFNDTPLYRFSGEAFGTSTEFRSVELGIESFAGKAGEIRFVLTSDQNTAARAQIANLHLDGSPIAPSTAPRLALAVPTAGRRIMDGTVIASGTASRGTSKVWVRLNGGLPEQATGTLAWHAHLTDLRPGDNEIACWAEDETGVISEILRRTFRRVVSSPLAVTVVGQGSVTRGFLGSSTREVDASLSLTATPAKDWMFTGWSGDLSGRAPRLDFKMREGMRLTATFVPNPFIGHEGTYMDHTEAAAPLHSAMISAVITQAGGVTLTLVHQGRTYRATGQFDANGLLSLYFNRTGQPPLSLHLAMEFTTGEITGTLKEGGADIGTVGAIRSPWTTRAPTSLPPRYTLVFDQPAAPMPPAYGYGTLTLTPAGAITWSGKLPDGSPVTQGARLLSDDTWIMQVSTHRGKGWAGGTVKLSPALQPEPVTGEVFWSKPAASGNFLPAAFSGALDVFGGVFQDLSRSTAPLFPGLPMQADQMQMEWGAGLFSSPASTLLTLNSRRQFIFPTAGNSAVVNLQTGLITGKLRHPDGRTSLSYQGVALPGHTSGYGQFTTATSTAAVLLKPAPGVIVRNDLFQDNFDRADSIEAGNGWSNSTTLTGEAWVGTSSMVGNLRVLGQRLVNSAASGAAAIYRSFDHSSGVRVRATLTHVNGWGGLQKRYVHALGVRSNGTAGNGLAVVFYRADSGFNNSTVSLYDGSTLVGQQATSFQFETAIRATVEFRQDGSVQVQVANADGSAGEQTLTFASRAVSAASSNVIFVITGSQGSLKSSLDDVMMEKF